MTTEDRDQLRGEHLAKVFGDYANYYGKGDEFASAMSMEHRTIQQSMFRIFMAWVEDLSFHYREGTFDARNEAACKAANTIMGAFEGQVPPLPMI